MNPIFSYKNIAIPGRNESSGVLHITQPKITNPVSPIISFLEGLAALKFSLRIFSPLLILGAMLLCIGCGSSSDIERVGNPDGGATSYSADADGEDTKVDGGTQDAGTEADSSNNVNPGDEETDGGASSDAGGVDSGGTAPLAFPINFDDGEDCNLHPGITTTGTTVNAVAQPYPDDSPNPIGGKCFLKILEISSDGVITIEFTNPQDISGSSYLTFDVSHKDERALNSAIMFMLLLMDEDDNFANVSNTLSMDPDIWYRVSLSLDQFLDSDLDTGNGALNRHHIKRFKIRPFNGSVGMGPSDLVSELDFDNFSTTGDDQTGPIVTE